MNLNMIAMNCHFSAVEYCTQRFASIFSCDFENKSLIKKIQVDMKNKVENKISEFPSTFSFKDSRIMVAINFLSSIVLSL